MEPKEPMEQRLNEGRACFCQTGASIKKVFQLEWVAATGGSLCRPT